jgi:hypothetical protein
MRGWLSDGDLGLKIDQTAVYATVLIVVMGE